jgi:hypothetical protein
MNKEKILLMIGCLESTIKLLKLELGDVETEEPEQPNNTISLRELIGNISNDEYEPDYQEVD